MKCTSKIQLDEVSN